MSYVYSGRYYWDTGHLYDQTVHGVYWSPNITNSINGYLLYMYSVHLVKSNNNNKRNGLTLRCVTDSYANHNYNAERSRGAYYCYPL